MLKLENLRSFLAVANAGNIADAAVRLGRTPSAVSMTLKQLEADIGGPLFETDRKNALTALGRYTVASAAAQISGYDAATRAIRAFAANKIGRLSVASVPSVAAYLVPAILPSFAAARPSLEIDILDADSRSVAGMVDNGICELGIAGPPVAGARLSFVPLFSDRYRVVFGPTSALGALKRPLVWRDLERETFIRNEASDAIELHELRAQYFQAGMVVRNVTSLLALVRAGMGITLLPSLATTAMPDGVVARDIDFRGEKRVVGIMFRASVPLSPVGQAFCDHFQTAMPELGHRLNLSVAK